MKAASPLKGSFRFQHKDGTIERIGLPPARAVKIGGKANVLLVTPKDGRPANQRLLVVWFERVKGGWELIEKAGKLA